MWRSWSIRILVLLCGTWAVRIRFGFCGVIIFRIYKVRVGSWFVGEGRVVFGVCINVCCFVGFIFVVDSNDRERVNEVREEFMRMLAEDEFRDVVLFVFVNK